MPVASVALMQVALPEFGEPTVMPSIPLTTYEARIALQKRIVASEFGSLLPSSRTLIR